MHDQNKFISFFEMHDRKKRHVTDCGVWDLYRQCPLACLLQTQVRLTPRQYANKFVFKDLLKSALRRWHQNNERAEAEAVLHVGGHGMMRTFATHNDINSWDVLMDYIDFDGCNPLNWCYEQEVFMHHIKPPDVEVLKPGLVLADRVDGLVMHEGEPYLLVHMPVKEIRDLTEFFLTDFSNRLKAAFGGPALGHDIQGIVYNLVAYDGALTGGAKNSFGMCRQRFDFELDDLEKTKDEFWDLASRYNGVMAQPLCCNANRKYCHHDGEVCIYKPLCDSKMNPVSRRLYQYATVNPHHTIEERQNILEQTFHISARP